MEFNPEQKADGGAVAEQVAANDKEAKADAELLKKYREFWAYLIMGVDTEQAEVGPELTEVDHEQAEVDPEQLEVDREAVTEREAANAEEAKADAELLKKQKEFWSYIVIFFLHLHCCSVRDIFSVLQSYDIESTEGDIARCIEENKLLTHNEVLPHDNRERSVFKFNELPESLVECINTNLFRFTMTHPMLPVVRSAALVYIKDPEGRRIVIKASRRQIVFSIIRNQTSLRLVPLYLHYRRCMGRAVGIELDPDKFVALDAGAVKLS
ncbi:hypothetical protein MMC29_003715 [Sticta canariensis]|nr:hypothetical protein [Sticta canariensis]